MTATFYWFVPTNGDSRYIGLPKPEREPTLDYVVQVARTAERLGFYGILVPAGTPYLESWMVASAIVHHTETIRPLVAFRPGVISPAVAAKMASTLDQFSRGRLTVNVVTGGSPFELGQDGDFVEHDARYERTDEFLQVVKKLWDGQPVNHHGKFFRVENGQLIPPNFNRRNIPIYFGGSSEAAIEVAAKHADIYLQWGEPVEQVRRQIDKVEAKAAAYGRTVEYGVRIHVIVRETEREAWEAAERLISHIDPEVERRMSNYYRETDSVAQKRMNELLKGDFRFGKYKWAGIGRVRKGAGTAIVGTPEQVKEGIEEYLDAGVKHFILSGFPHVEEAELFGERVLPLFFPTRSQKAAAR